MLIIYSHLFFFLIIVMVFTSELIICEISFFFRYKNRDWKLKVKRMMDEMWRTTVYCDVNCTFIYFCLHCSYNSFRRQFCCQSINWQWLKENFDLSLFLGEKSNFVDLKRSRSTFNHGCVRIGSGFNILRIK